MLINEWIKYELRRRETLDAKLDFLCDIIIHADDEKPNDRVFGFVQRVHGYLFKDDRRQSFKNETLSGLSERKIGRRVKKENRSDEVAE